MRRRADRERMRRYVAKAHRIKLYPGGPPYSLSLPPYLSQSEMEARIRDAARGLAVAPACDLSLSIVDRNPYDYSVMQIEAVPRVRRGLVARRDTSRAGGQRWGSRPRKDP